MLAALAGCGAGTTASQDVALLITEDFGAGQLLRAELPAQEGETVAGLLERAGRPGDATAAGSVHVNGVASEDGARERVRPGDQVWIDLHGEAVPAPQPPAVVGAFPAPFTTGIGADRIPTRVECVDPGSEPCRAVTETLVDLGLPAGSGGVGNARADETLRVLVGPWSRLRNAAEASGLISAGPARSGVYARFTRDARSLQLLDSAGRPSQTLAAGAGLIAATQAPGRRPVWFVTGTDAAGVRAAAQAFGVQTLGQKLAVAIADGRAVRLPSVTPSAPDGRPNA
ncbi:MAG TPA: hypothetical protein VGW11_10425 [Solirubrobacteraceae bacterium]|nr:hypothetical protein [Solirubrobacteraceae bacterium]